MAEMNFRPGTLAEVAERVTKDAYSFDMMIREFLDSWQSLTKEQRSLAVQDEPQTLGPIEDSYIAAVAEHLSASEGLAAQAWTEKPSRFLDVPSFAGGLESLKAALIVESPAAFRRRLIFISANALDRPVRTVMPAE